MKKSYIYYNYQNSINPKSQLITPNIKQQLKQNIGLKITNLNITGTTSDANQGSITTYQDIQAIYARRPFYFELTDSEFSNNHYCTSC